ncbi:hypothetical protein AAFF_G00430110 [Aldrovandia affinis]|uniref:Mitochondrial transcription rescue factor 1 C-terminal domain-containing protein n=1 Tax=Aldrovandia affinis TaxID=143900 RepID=A0AAD7S9G7_9TELE|nr:hypothetical protein AAFF_G00430110 [Aldrovandia affinis]
MCISRKRWRQKQNKGVAAMMGLRVPVLMFRQLAGLTSLPRDALVHGCHSSAGCPRPTLSRQVCSSVSPLVLGKRLAPGFLCPAQSWSTHLVRFKTNKGSKKGRKATRELEGEDEEDDPEASDYEDELQDDPHLPKDYKDQERSVQSFRYDVIMKAGMDISHNKVDHAFYSNKLRLNGQKLIKKSKTVKIGDTLDLVLEEDKATDTVTVMRVIFKKVTAVTKDAERYKVVLRRWKHLKLPQHEAFKP